MRGSTSVYRQAHQSIYHGDELARAFVDATTPRRGPRSCAASSASSPSPVEKVVVVGQPAQLDAAQQVLAAARRSLYRILAGDETGSRAPTPGGDADRIDAHDAAESTESFGPSE